MIQVNYAWKMNDHASLLVCFWNRNHKHCVIVSNERKFFSFLLNYSNQYGLMVIDVMPVLFCALGHQTARNQSVRVVVRAIINNWLKVIKFQAEVGSGFSNKLSDFKALKFWMKISNDDELLIGFFWIRNSYETFFIINLFRWSLNFQIRTAKNYFPNCLWENIFWFPYRNVEQHGCGGKLKLSSFPWFFVDLKGFKMFEHFRQI